MFDLLMNKCLICIYTYVNVKDYITFSIIAMLSLLYKINY